MGRPITIQIDSHLKNVGENHDIIECDDYLMIYSKVNGATFDPEGNKEPSLTRDVSAGIGGFKTMSDIYNRLTQGTLQFFSLSEDPSVNDYNLVNYISELIKYGGLSEKVRLTVTEDLLANAGKAPIPKEKKKEEK